MNVSSCGGARLVRMHVTIYCWISQITKMAGKAEVLAFCGQYLRHREYHQITGLMLAVSPSRCGLFI